MSIKGKAYVVGDWDRPRRKIPDLSTAQVQAECAMGALKDAGLSKGDVDAYCCAGDAGGPPVFSFTSA
jgi:acetyl-CoA C-acetyltransferase